MASQYSLQLLVMDEDKLYCELFTACVGVIHGFLFWINRNIHMFDWRCIFKPEVWEVLNICHLLHIHSSNRHRAVLCLGVY